MSKEHKSSESKTEKNEKSQLDDEDATIPYRKIECLYTPKITLNCALSNCIPCAYKIACFDVALDKQFTSLAPNKRPEQCLRSNNQKKGIQLKPDITTQVGYLGYRHGMNVLTVGDGDFSFSLALARILLGDECNSHKGRLIVSSYESLSTLKSTYPNIQETLSLLQSLGAQVLFQVDATCLHENKTLGDIQKRKDFFFHRVIWNFPCTAEPNGQDGQNGEMDRNKEMVRQFVDCSNEILDPISGEIHMAHKTKPPYDQWMLQNMASHCPAISYLGRVVVDRSCFPPYTPRKALDRKSFTCHDACFFIFGRKIDDSDLLKESDNKEKRFLPTIPLSSSDPNIDVVPVTKKILSKIRSLHYSEALLRKAQGGKNKKKRTFNENKNVGSNSRFKKNKKKNR